MSKKFKTRFWLVIALILAAISSYYQIDNGNEKFQENGSTVAPFAKAIVDDYEVLDGSELLRNRRNDGDSFLVKHRMGKTEFCLYYVDTPESRYKEYANGENNGDRILEQGIYFGGLPREKTTELGINFLS